MHELRNAPETRFDPTPDQPRNLAGVGLKAPHYREIIDAGPDLGWFEVHPENYMTEGGPPHRYLERIRQDYPLSLHSVGCSLGSHAPIEQTQLDWMVRLADRYEPFLVSDHISWSAAGGTFLNDLLPLPYTDESLQAIAANVDRLQTALGRQILVENPSAYLQFRADSLTEPQFLAELTTRTGCGLLLDINNVYVSAMNHGFDPWDHLSAIPHEAVREIHLAGHAVDLWDGTEIRIDDHGDHVCDAVWDLFRRYVATFTTPGAAPVTLIEWDTNVPEFEVLKAEADHAAAIITDAGNEARDADAA